MPAGITVTRDAEDPALFHVSGRRVSGRVRASIHFVTKQRFERAEGEPEERIEVHASMNRYRPSEDDSETITVNGVKLDGYRAVQINDPWRPNVRRDGYLHRVGGDWNATPSDAAYEVWSEVVDQVADLFGTDEAVHAARVARAADTEAKAFAAYREAEQALKDARAAHRAVIIAGPQPITRPKSEV